MGYTHYFTFKVPKGIKAAKLEAQYQLAIKECARVARVYNQECLENGLTHERLSGYTAHSKPNSYGGIQINGKADLAHEEFTLREHFKQNEAFNFCKTARKPYDMVVVACLAILKYRLGNAIEVSTDGCRADWIEGVKLAQRITKRKVLNPIERIDRRFTLVNGKGE